MFGILPTRVHGCLDYLMGIVLMAVPLAFGFGAGPQTWLPVLLGGGIIIYSLFTDYELAVVPVFPVPSHLVTDALIGLLVAASPWLCGFAWEMWVPHVLIGLAVVGAAIFTQTQAWPNVQPTLRFRPAAGERANNELRASA